MKHIPITTEMWSRSSPGRPQARPPVEITKHRVVRGTYTRQEPVLPVNDVDLAVDIVDEWKLQRVGTSSLNPRSKQHRAFRARYACIGKFLPIFG